ncbi:MAG: putative lipoprotein [Gammaproteobacteria bacterium]|nr:putative lipoprotein [Gammaproteobacteria bacterium]
MLSAVLELLTLRVRQPILLAVLVLLCAASAHAEPAPFDLAGPSLAVTVTRGQQTLPITQVPNLAPGDRLWIQADFPASQAAHYLMVAAFLRGATNPPPQSWFFQCETWTAKCMQKGLTVTVPADAQQVLVFLAPETSGDFRTLVSAVMGRPGAFVRSSQDLNQASLDRARLEKYLSAVRSMNDTDPSRLKDVAPLLARSLAIKLDDKCLDRNPLLQAPCLMQGQSSLILNDGHSTSIVEALTSGPASDLAMEASFTPQLSYGYYSPYIASVLDIARIFDSFRTAQYQYIPALTTQQGELLATTLNTPPSFHNPKSVLVIALPAVEQAQLPPLHAVDPKATFCLRKSTLSLPVEGAPLVFSTAYAHDLTLRLTRDDGKTVELPARADAQHGGFVIDTKALGAAAVGDHVRASLQGYWGFEKYSAPSFELVNTRAQSWELAAADEGALTVGRDKTIHLQANNVSCLDSVMLKGADGTEHAAEWKAVKPNEVEVTLPLQSAKPGALTLLVTQYGASQAQPVQLQAFSEAAHLDSFALRAGDNQGVLKGSRLDQVSSLAIQGVEFVPGKLETSQSSDQLAMVTRDTQPVTALRQGDVATAKVLLNDGRTIAVNTSVGAPRPRVTLLGKSMQTSASTSESNIELANPDELPQDAKLTFSMRAQSPPTFVRDEQIEVAMADETASTTLSIANGGITLENSKVAVATLDPTKALGSSAFGPLLFRSIVNGVAGDWQPLATLVRLPGLRELKCPASAELACKLSGSSLFLVDSVSSDADFAHAVQVPDGFPGYSLPVPHPNNGLLYVKLRDDPTVVSRATLTTQQLPPSPEEVARASERQAAAPVQGPAPQ